MFGVTSMFEQEKKWDRRERGSRGWEKREEGSSPLRVACVQQAMLLARSIHLLDMLL